MSDTEALIHQIHWLNDFDLSCSSNNSEEILNQVAVTILSLGVKWRRG